MKKILLTILIGALCGFAILFSLVACNEEHIHVFNKEVIHEKYLEMEATCLTLAKYFYSCACGEKGNDSFEYGESLGHNIETILEQKPTCIEDGWDAYNKCTRCNYSTFVVKNALGHDYKEGKCKNCEDIKKYTVNWIDFDNTILETDSVYYGEIPEYNGLEPNRQKTVYQTFTFVGWDKEVSSITEDINFKAKYKVEDTLFTLSFDSNGGELIDSGATIKGKYYETISLPKIKKPGYYFKGWDITPKLSVSSGLFNGEKYNIKQDAVFTAVWAPLFVIEGNTIVGYNDYTSGPDDFGTGIIEYPENKVEVPSMIDGKEIKAIGDFAFYNCYKITHVSLPNSVKSIGRYAFGGCSNLRGVGLGGTEIIQAYAFSSCTSLSSIIITESVNKIEYCAFYECKKLSIAIFRDTEDWNKAVYKNNGSGDYGSIIKISVEDEENMALELKSASLIDFYKE